MNPQDAQGKFNTDCRTRYVVGTIIYRPYIFDFTTHKFILRDTNVLKSDKTGDYIVKVWDFAISETNKGVTCIIPSKDVQYVSLMEEANWTSLEVTGVTEKCIFAHPIIESPIVLKLRRKADKTVRNYIESLLDAIRAPFLSPSDNVQSNLDISDHVQGMVNEFVSSPYGWTQWKEFLPVLRIQLQVSQANNEFCTSIRVVENILNDLGVLY